MQYKNAPIQEAVFDIRVNKVSNVDVMHYESLRESVLSEYPKTEQKIQVSGKYRFEKSDFITEHGTPKKMGIIFTNNEGNKKVQFRKDGFTFNQLKPYSSWDNFSREAFKYWNIYKQEIKPDSINRIALRYINKIDLPLNDDLNFSNYFLNIPPLPSTFNQGYLSLFVRIKAQCSIGDFIANVTSKFDKPEDNYLPFLIDIDVFSNRNFAIDKNLNEEFLKIRENKNEIFESIITDKTRDLFK
jgi:uncharacterized protein (TIGR04255 family)